MPYKFATLKQDYSDLASGRVLYSLPGHPAFPVRLANEIFLRCVAQCGVSGDAPRLVLYDPCCGSAYHLTTLAFQHGSSLQAVIGSDVDTQAVQVASRNVALLTPEGLDRRVQELTADYHTHGKESHRAALRSAEALGDQVRRLTRLHPIQARVFHSSAFDAKALRSQFGGIRADIVLTDVPYGHCSDWRVEDQDQAEDPIGAMLRAVRGILHARSIVAVASVKRQQVADDGYMRVERFQLGKRQIVLLKPRP